MTAEQLKKYVPRSGRARYRAKYTLVWGTRRKPGVEFEYDYPVEANPDAYEIVEVLIKPKLKGKPKAKRAAAAAVDAPSKVDSVFGSEADA